MDEALSVAVLVPTYRRPDALASCLRGLAAQQRRPDRVLVVARTDDAPTHRALDAAPAELTLERILVERPGQVAALNAGLERLREDVVAITDDDSVPRPDWLQRILRHFAADPRLGALGGRDWVRHGDRPVDGTRRTVGRVHWYGRFVGFHHLGTGKPREVDFLKGVNMSYRRDAVRRLWFDTGLTGGGAQHHNDWAFSLAVKRRGWRVLYDPAVAVDHAEQERPDGDPRFAVEPEVAAARAHNQTYVAARYLPARRAAVHVLYVYAVGTRSAPGLLITLHRLASRRQPAALTMRELILALRARSSGLIAGVRAGRPAG